MHPLDFTTTSLVSLITAVVFTSYYAIRPLLLAKVKLTQHHQLLQALKVTEQLANFIVPELAVMAELDNTGRKAEAIRFVTAKLNEQGIVVKAATVSAAVENAYQLYKHVINGDQHNA